MKAVLQRVAEASVVVGGETVGRIGRGLLVLVCAERGDSEAQADKLLAKILKLRIFSDDAGKMFQSTPLSGRIWKRLPLSQINSILLKGRFQTGVSS